MNKTLILLGASIVTLGTMYSSAEARLVRYEINGKEYSYSTNNRAQAAEARKRIAAAKAADAAKAKADAEKSKYPLAAAFGSQAQKDAKEADERLQELLSGEAKTKEDSPSTSEYVTVSEIKRKDRDSDTKDKVSDAKPKDKKSRPATVDKTPQPSPAPIRVSASPARVLPAITAPIFAVSADPQRQTGIKSVSFDIQAGIKTTIMHDGTIEEEPFDSTTLSVLAPEPEKMNSLMAFVNQLRKIAPEESTGSIVTSVAEPEDGTLIRHR